MKNFLWPTSPPLTFNLSIFCRDYRIWLITSLMICKKWKSPTKASTPSRAGRTFRATRPSYRRATSPPCSPLRQSLPLPLPLTQNRHRKQKSEAVQRRFGGPFDDSKGKKKTKKKSNFIQQKKGSWSTSLTVNGPWHRRGRPISTTRTNASSFMHARQGIS